MSLKTEISTLYPHMVWENYILHTHDLKTNNLPIYGFTPIAFVTHLIIFNDKNTIKH